MAKYFVRYSYVENGSWKNDGGIISATITDIQSVKDAVLTNLLGGATLPIEISNVEPLEAGSGGGGGTAYNNIKQTVLKTATTHDVNINTAHSVDIAVLTGTAQIIIDDAGATVTADVSAGFTTQYTAGELIAQKISIVCPNTDAYIIVTENY